VPLKRSERQAVVSPLRFTASPIHRVAIQSGLVSRHPDPDSAPKTILLVEDESLIAIATRHTLESAGYRVEIARNGEDAVRVGVQDPSINLILMDIDLGPGIDGTTAAQRILEAREIPIVFLSSHTEKELVDKVRGITRYGYVIKNSGDFVLNASLEMAFELFEANRREQEQAARLGAIVQAQPDRMFVVGVDGTFREAYTPHHASLAIPEDRIAGAHLRDMFGEQETERHMAAYRTCVETGELQSFEYEMESPSNPRRFEARISKLDNQTVLAIVREVTESRRMEDELNRLVGLHRMLVDVSTSCINIPGARIPEAIRSALGTMARAIGADRAYVFDYDFDRQIAINRFEWCSPGTEPQMDLLQSLPLQEIEAGVARHREGMPHHVPVVADLPEGRLRDVLEPQGIQSMLAVPMLSDGACIGSVGFDFVAEPHTFSMEENALLTVFAELLVNLREREAVEERLRVLFDGARDCILVHEIGPDGLPGTYIDVNQSTCETLGYSREELLTMSPLDTTAPDDLDLIPKNLATLKDGDSVLVEARGRRKDGTPVPFELNIHRITVNDRERSCSGR